jgi:hypothetical protein
MGAEPKDDEAREMPMGKTSGNSEIKSGISYKQ